MYNYALYAVLAIPILAWAWLSIATSVALYRHKGISDSQRKQQMVLAWTVPFIGAIHILRLIYQHDEKAVPLKMFPWPLSLFVFGKLRKIPGGVGDGDGVDDGSWYFMRNSTDTYDGDGGSD